jgi:DNA-binding response OmpR family regulator
VVEDEESLRKVAKRALEVAGYTVLTAANGKEAISLCAQYSGDIQLLLTDVVMPGLNGRALALELLKTHERLKVLYMSGYTDDAIGHHGVLDPGTHFIGKPFTGHDLARKVREVLDGGTTPVDGAQDQEASADAELMEQPLDKDALRGLSRELLSKLSKAVCAARYDEMVEIIETVRIIDPEVAIGLRRLADRFDCDRLRELLGTDAGR